MILGETSKLNKIPEVNMIKKSKKSISLLLCLAIFLSMVIPVSAATPNKISNFIATGSDTGLGVNHQDNSMDVQANRKKRIGSIYDPAKWLASDYGVVLDPIQKEKKDSSSNSKGVKPVERMNAVKNDFNPLMQQITAYFYHEFSDLLDETQQKEMMGWNPEKINDLISSLSQNQINMLNKYAPVVTEQFAYHRDPTAYKAKHQSKFTKDDELEREDQIKLDNQSVNAQKHQGTDKKKESSKVSILTANDYLVTPFKNQYNYSSNTEDLVDTLYNTSNRSVYDLSLPGKDGLDIQLRRNYNSLESQILTPTYHAVQDASGYYTQSEGNAAVTVNPADIPGFIATGWSLNLPSMQRADIQAEVVPWTYTTGCLSSGSYQGTGSCYRSGYSYQTVTSYEKVSFSLDNGLSVDFRNGVAFDYPYQNLAYAKNYNSATGKYEYLLTINSMITYKFDDQGKIISKTNAYGNQVTYAFANDTVNGIYDITIIDSYGRKITVFRNASSVITGFKAEDGTTLLKQVQYNVSQPTAANVVYRKWTTGGYTNVTENLAYWQLNDVKDTTQGSNTLESYEYYPIDSTKLADFNMKPDGYAFDYSSPTGELVLAPYQEYNYWSWVYIWTDSNGVATAPIELVQIVDANKQTYGETPFLLMKNINMFNGLQVQYSYQNYSTAWTSSGMMNGEDVRGSTRLFQDKYALQYYAYHQVAGVNYLFTENGSTQNILENYSNIHKDHGWQFNEYWKNDKSNIARLRTTSRYGNQQTLKKEIVRFLSGDKVTYSQYGNNGNNYVMTANWASTNNSSNGINKLSLTENGVQFSHKDEVSYYEYDIGKTIPKKEYRFGHDNADSLVDAGTTSFMSLPGLPATTTKLMRSYTYDSWGYPLTELDEIGNQTTYVYNGPFHQATSQTLQAQDGSTQLTQLYTYYASNHTDANKQNQLSQTKKIQTYLNPSTATTNTDTITTDYMSYNADKKLLQSMGTGTGDQFGVTSTTTQQDFTYNNRGQMLTASTLGALGTGLTPTNITITYAYDLLGRLTSTTYPDGKLVTNDSYDALNRLTSQTFYPVGASSRTIGISYLDSQRKVSVTSADQERRESFYSPFGEVVQENQIVKDLANVDQSRITSKNIFMSYSRMVVQNRPFGSSSFTTGSSYDSFGRISSQYDPLFQTTTYSYANVAKNISTGVETLQNVMQSVQPDGLKQLSYYDTYGRLIKKIQQTPTLSKTITTAYTYNSLGQLKSSIVTAGASSQSTQYGYDGWGQLIYLQDDKGQKYRYIYNRFGALESQSINGVLQKQTAHNEIGWVLSKTNAEGQQEKYQYFINGQIANYTDKAGQKTVYTYTPYGEQDRVSVLNPAGTEIYWQQNTYAAATRLLTEISNIENETLSYHYDIWKRNDTKTIIGQTYTFGYDSYDRMTSIVYPDNQKAIYTFDNLNRISTVNYKDSANVALMSPVAYTYSTTSNINTYRETFANGLKQEKQTDSFRELTTMKHFNNSTTANWTENFGYDGFGNINSLDRNSTAYSYQYDGLNRIQQENLPGGQNKYMYDDKGNRLTLESDNLPTNLNGSKQYTYNAINQVKTFTDNAGTTASYTYYGDGLRATKTVNGQLTRYVYVNGKIIEELDAIGTSKARNIWGNELLYRKNSTATDSQGGYYFFNGHGDVVKVTDNSGNVLNAYDYDIWGNLTSKTETMNNPFKYTGEMQDDETGNVYLRARYYDPAVGRFINEDSYEGDVANPLTLNQYAYVHNNPLVYADPTGHWCESAAKDKNGNSLWSNSGGCNIGTKGEKVNRGVNGSVWTDDWFHNKQSIIANGKTVGTYIDPDQGVKKPSIGEELLITATATLAIAAAIITAPAILATAEVATMGTTTGSITAGTAGAGVGLTTFYHVTSKGSAQTIMETGIIGNASKQEAGQVFAFIQKPTAYQASQSGARAFDTLLEFKSPANAFSIPDNTIDLGLQAIARKASTSTVSVTSVKEVGFKAVWYKPWTWFRN